MIALGSIEHGIGVTHISLALSNFLCNKLGKKTAYIELNATNQICSLAPGTGNTSFTYIGIHVFPCTTFTSLPEILRMEFDYFILDMGVLNTYTAKEFFKFEKQFLVCSLSKWKQKQTLAKLEQLLKENYIQSGCLVVLSTSNIKESHIPISNRLHLKIGSIPFISNPFQLHPEFFTFLQKLIG